MQHPKFSVNGETQNQNKSVQIMTVRHWSEDLPSQCKQCLLFLHWCLQRKSAYTCRYLCTDSM